MKAFQALGLLAIVCLVVVDANGGRSRSRSRSGSDSNSREHHKRRPNANDIARIKASLDELAAGGNPNLLRFMHIWIGKYPDTVIVHPQFKDLHFRNRTVRREVLAFGNVIFADIAQLVGKVESGSHEELKVFIRTYVRRPGLFGATLNYYRNLFSAIEWTFDSVLGYKFSRRDKEAWDRLTRYALWYFKRALKHYQLFDGEKRRIRETFREFLRHHHVNNSVTAWIKEELSTYPENKAYFPELAAVPDAEFDTSNDYVYFAVQRRAALLRDVAEKLDSMDDLRALVVTVSRTAIYRGLPSAHWRRSLDALIVVFGKRLHKKFSHHDREAVQKLSDIVVSMIETSNAADEAADLWDSPLRRWERAKLDFALAKFRAAANYPRFFELWFEEFPGGRCHFEPIRNLKIKFFHANNYIKNIIGPQIAAAIHQFLKFANDPAKLGAGIRALLVSDEFEAMNRNDIKNFIEAYRLALIDFFDAKGRYQKFSSEERRHHGPKGLMKRSSEERRGGSGSDSSEERRDHSGRKSSEERRDHSGRKSSEERRRGHPNKPWHHKHMGIWTKFFKFLFDKFSEQLTALPDTYRD